MALSLTPPYTPDAHIDASLRERGFAVLAPKCLGRLLGWQGEGVPLAALTRHWQDLPIDEHLRDGGRYRRRRHGSFLLEAGVLSQVPHRAHWQPLEYNALHGGMQRWFEPLSAELVGENIWEKLLMALSELASKMLDHWGTWYIEAHSFRIDTAGGIGRPTPEGAHRDGVDMVAVILVGSTGIKGGETRVFDATSPNGQRFTMSEPGTTLLIDDARTIHETTPIQPLSGQHPGSRDTLVLTWRRNSFQDPVGEP